MKTSDLAAVLNDRNDAAPGRVKAAHVALFATELQSHSTAKVAAVADIGKWPPQLALGRKLANFVTLK